MIVNLDFRRIIGANAAIGIDGVFVCWLELDIVLSDRILPRKRPAVQVISNGEGTIDLFPSLPYNTRYHAALLVNQGTDFNKPIWTGNFAVPDGSGSVELSQLIGQTPFNPNNLDSSVNSIVTALLANTEFQQTINETIASLVAEAANETAITIISATTALAPNRGYWVDSPALVTLQLPAAQNLDWLELYQAGTGEWRLQQQAGQQMRLGAVTTTLGVSGRIGSTAPGDRVRLVYRSSLNRWESTLIQGNIEVI